MPRWEWLPFFLNKITKKSEFIEKNVGFKTKIDGDYLIFKNGNDIYLIMSIKKGKEDFILQTFVCNNGYNYYNPELKIAIEKITIS